jgi:hypothetical protein
MFSLRQSLIEQQGVTLETSVKAHCLLVHEMIKRNATLRANRYRVNPDNPNSITEARFI